MGIKMRVSTPETSIPPADVMPVAFRKKGFPERGPPCILHVSSHRCGDGIATGIGSLPHLDPREACRLIRDLFPEIPFWPQLPRRSPMENMYHQYAEGMPGMMAKRDGGFYIDEGKDGFYEELERFYEAFLAADLERFRISEDYAAGLYAWLEGREHMRSAWGIKGQVTGPISFGLQVTQADKRSILYNETLRDVMVKQLLRKAQWQVATMRQIHPRPILFLDEPYLAAFGSAFTSIDRDTVLSTFREIFSGIDATTASIAAAIPTGPCCLQADRTSSRLMHIHISIPSSSIPRNLRVSFQRAASLPGESYPPTRRISGRRPPKGF